MNCGIYKIENLITGDFYIGQSVRLSHRKSTHFMELKRNRHSNKYLQRIFNKYGYKNILFKILLYCEEPELVRYEQALVDRLNPKYNLCKECVSNKLGLKLSEETKQKISFSLMGHPILETTKEKIRMASSGKFMQNKGRKFTEEHKYNISKSLTGRKLSEEHRAKISAGNMGHHPTEETKHKLSETQRGKDKWNEDARLKMSEARKGKPSQRKGIAISEEQKHKISESMKRYCISQHLIEIAVRL